MSYRQYTFTGHSGFLAPAGTETAPDAPAHRHAGLGHTARLEPWVDPGLHYHAQNEEFYLLLSGKLSLLVDNHLLSLHPWELLVVKPGIPHAITGGEGPIEHFGLRAPNLPDKQACGNLPRNLPPLSCEGARMLRQEWGYRIPLAEAPHQNCWLLGTGQALFASPNLALAWLVYDTHAAATAGLGTRHRLHLHAQSWEYYVVIRGTKVLQVEKELVGVKAGEVLEIPPGVKHCLADRSAPFVGFTFRAPILEDKVEA